jgi:hypothetical protein
LSIKATEMLANTTQAQTNQWPSLLVLCEQIEMIKIWNEILDRSNCLIFEFNVGLLILVHMDLDQACSIKHDADPLANNLSRETCTDVRV